MFRSNQHRRATRAASAVLAGLGALATGVYGNVSGASSVPSVKIGVPAYFWPGGYWDKIVANSADISLAVANIATGPGAAKNASFATQFASAKAAGITLFGYVDTTYGARSAALVKTDIANYKSWYGITNIFFDETPWACDATAYYVDLQSTVHANGGTGIMNPGGSSLECWASVGDIIVNFEGSGVTYDSWAPDAWTNQHPASKFWHIVYGTLGPQVSNVVAKTKERNAATVFVTDDVLPNPFDRLPDPTVWTPLLKAIGPVVAPITTETTAGGSSTPTTTSAVTATTPPPIITNTEGTTTTTEAPTTTVAPTTMVAPTTIAPTTSATPTTPASTVAPTTPKTTTAPTTIAPKTPASTPFPATTKPVVPTPAAPTPGPVAAAPAVAPAAASAKGETVFGAAPSGGGVVIVNAPDANGTKSDAKPDAARSGEAPLDKQSAGLSKSPSGTSESGSASPFAAPSSAATSAKVQPTISGPDLRPTTTIPNKLALRTPTTKKLVVPTKSSNKRVVARVAPKSIAKAPKAIAKAGPKIPVAKAPLKSVAAKPVAVAKPMALQQNP